MIWVVRSLEAACALPIAVHGTPPPFEGQHTGCLDGISDWLVLAPLSPKCGKLWTLDDPQYRSNDCDPMCTCVWIGWVWDTADESLSGMLPGWQLLLLPEAGPLRLESPILCACASMTWQVCLVCMFKAYVRCFPASISLLRWWVRSMCLECC